MSTVWFLISMLLVAWIMIFLLLLNVVGVSAETIENGFVCVLGLFAFAALVRYTVGALK